MKRIVSRFATVIAVAGMLVGAAVGSAQAAGSASDGYAAQAARIGLSKAQAASLQREVDTYLTKNGGTQVGINKIQLDDGVLLVPLPGEQHARDLAIPADAQINGCPYYDFCVYSGTYYSGNVHYWSSCTNHQMTWSGPGSWINNQSTGTRARMKNSAYTVIYTTPGAYSSDPTGDWTPVYWVQPC